MSPARRKGSSHSLSYHHLNRKTIKSHARYFERSQEGRTHTSLPRPKIRGMANQVQSDKVYMVAHNPQNSTVGARMLIILLLDFCQSLSSTFRTYLEMAFSTNIRVFHFLFSLIFNTITFTTLRSTAQQRTLFQLEHSHRNHDHVYLQ